MLTPNELVLTFRACYLWATISENRSRNATMRVQTETDSSTDTNGIYHLSHALCYSCGADNKVYAYGFVLE